MTIADILEKSKARLAATPRDVLIVSTFLGSSLLSFGLGYAAGSDAGQGSAPLLKTSPSVISSATSTSALRVVASKNGTKYYPPDCAGAKRISDGNKIWFDSPELAESNGYERAAQCTGI
jgi:hypothetical protein